MKKTVLAIFCICFHVPLLFSHGDVHERIKALSEEIKANPDSVALYLVRGEMYHAHQLYKKAIKDFKTCKRKGLKSNRVYLSLAKSYHERGKSRKALRQLKRILNKEPQYVRALRLQGNILLDEGNFCAARVPLEEVIEILKDRQVENYLELAAAHQDCTDSGSKGKAILVLEKGIADLGPLLILFERLKNIALQQQDYKTAIEQQDAIIKYSIRKEKPYFERALLYTEISETEKAQNDLKTSQSLVRKLPIRFQQMESIQKLQRQIVKTMNLILDPGQ